MSTSKLTSAEARHFTIEGVLRIISHHLVDRAALRPAQLPGTRQPRRSSPEKPKRVTIFETPELQLVGSRSEFLAPKLVPVRVGDRVETGVQLLQLWVRSQIGRKKCSCSIRRTAMARAALCRRQT